MHLSGPYNLLLELRQKAKQARYNTSNVLDVQTKMEKQLASMWG